mmetsp:Transcript_94584/g.294196  ORF Transcript_94584/g.294196 Transcript_94584/m.294196 type:complete len:297 (-) Transcript_94584:166-1056(-)
MLPRRGGHRAPEPFGRDHEAAGQPGVAAPELGEAPAGLPHAVAHLLPRRVRRPGEPEPAAEGARLEGGGPPPALHQQDQLGGGAGARGAGAPPHGAGGRPPRHQARELHLQGGRERPGAQARRLRLCRPPEGAPPPLGRLRHAALRRAGGCPRAGVQGAAHRRLEPGHHAHGGALRPAPHRPRCKAEGPHQAHGGRRAHPSHLPAAGQRRQAAEEALLGGARGVPPRRRGHSRRHAGRQRQHTLAGLAGSGRGKRSAGRAVKALGAPAAGTAASRSPCHCSRRPACHGVQRALLHA